MIVLDILRHLLYSVQYAKTQSKKTNAIHRLDREARKRDAGAASKRRKRET